MCRRAMTCAAMWCVLLMAVGTAFGGEVVVKPWGAPDKETFPHETPPGDLPEGEAADATPFVSVAGGGHEGTWDPATSTYTVKKVGEVTVTGNTKIRLPDDASDTLKGHEQGHDDLNKNEYDKNTKRKVEEAMKGFEGMKFKGEGATDAARQADALAKATKESADRRARAEQAILQQMAVLGEKYDKLTEHGTSTTNDTSAGKTKALAERDRAPKAGEHSFVPDGTGPKATSGGTVPLPVKLAATQPKVQTGQPNLPSFFDPPSTPFDPLPNRGGLFIQPSVFIGPAGAGVTHLSDTRMQIVDLQTQDLLLDGFIFELAHMPSTLPQYPWMLQGFLDIPPDEVQGIHNTINSPFLEELRQASNAGTRTFLWVFLDAPLFDTAGFPTGNPEGTFGLAWIGVAAPVPEPTGVVTMVLGAGALVTVLCRRRGVRS